MNSNSFQINTNKKKQLASYQYEDLLNFLQIHNPVSIAFFDNPNSVLNFSRAYQVDFIQDKDLVLCQVLSNVQRENQVKIYTYDDFDGCIFAPFIMGWKELPQDMQKRLEKDFKYTPDVYARMLSNFEKAQAPQYMVIGPLKWFIRNDLTELIKMTIFTCNSTQAYLMTVGYADGSGKKICSCISGHAACEVIPAILNNHHPWFTLPCLGARVIADAKDDEFWIGMTNEDLWYTYNRLKTTGLRYPLTGQLTDKRMMTAYLSKCMPCMLNKTCKKK